MINILYVIASLRKCGPTNQLSYIIKHLDREKFNPIILTISNENIDDSMYDFFNIKLDVDIYTLGFNNIDNILLPKKRLNVFLNYHKIDLIHSSGFKVDKLIDKMNIQIPILFTLRNFPKYDYPKKYGSLLGNYIAYSHLKIIKKQEFNCIACSKSISNEFKNLRLSINYVTNGVDIDRYKPGNKYSLRDNLNINKNKIVFIVSGELIKRKNTESIIKAFNNSNRRDAILLVAGNGQQFNELKYKYQSDNINFLGNVNNIIPYLQISDCIISASFAEGLPNSILEAMSCGLDTILSNIPSHLELYGNLKGNFFEPTDIDSLSKLVKDYKVHENNSRRLIENNFSSKAMSKKYQEYYLNILNKGNKHDISST